MRVRLACLAFAVCALPAVAGSVDLFQARGIRVRLVEDPWQLVFEDPSGTVLAEAPGSAVAAGPLAFRAGTTWLHATRALEIRRKGKGARVVAATADPDRRLEVRLRADGEGVVPLEMSIAG